jgi:hypothetical protein
METKPEEHSKKEE